MGGEGHEHLLLMSEQKGGDPRVTGYIAVYLNPTAGARLRGSMPIGWAWARKVSDMGFNKRQARKRVEEGWAAAAGGGSPRTGVFGRE